MSKLTLVSQMDEKQSHKVYKVARNFPFEALNMQEIFEGT